MRIVADGFKCQDDDGCVSGSFSFMRVTVKNKFFGLFQKLESFWVFGASRVFF